MSLAHAGRPFVYFVKADPSCTDQDVSQQRYRLGAQLQSLVNYMSNCDLEKHNEPIIVMFTRIAPQIMRTRLIKGAVAVGLTGKVSSFSSGPPGAASAGSFGGSSSGPSSGPNSPKSPGGIASLAAARVASQFSAGPGPGSGAWLEVSEEDQRRLKSLRRQLEEARDMANPRFVVLCDIDAPWDWTFVLLRSYARLRSALHRLYPQAPQLLADRRLNPRPSLIVMDDLTPPPDTVPRLRHKVGASLKPFLDWMAEEGEMEVEDEEVPLLFVCMDVRELAERFVLNTNPSLADLPDSELQRMLLARDRLLEVVRVHKPRMLVLVNWMQPSQWVFVLCRAYGRLLSGVGELCADRAVYTWPQRNLPTGSLGTGMPVEDYCYSNACVQRGTVHTVKSCPNCGVAKYCSSGCQQEHWAAGHCRMCPRLADGKLRAKMSGQQQNGQAGHQAAARAGGIEQSRLGR